MSIVESGKVTKKKDAEASFPDINLSREISDLVQQ
jgi:hypothetical protein